MFETVRVKLNEPLVVGGVTLTVVDADAVDGAVTLALSAADGAASVPSPIPSSPSPERTTPDD